MLRKAYIGFGVATALLYATAEMRGWAFSTSPRGFVPSNVRTSPGGYRSFHFWHTGYHGGK